MLEAAQELKSNQLVLDPADIEAPAVEEGCRRSALVFPPLGKLVKGRVIATRVESSVLPTFAGLGDRVFKEELSDLLRMQRRYSNSTTFLSRVSSLLQVCGDTNKAIEYASKAAEINPSPVFKQRLGEVYLYNRNQDEANQVFLALRDVGSVDVLLRLAESCINEQNFIGATELIDEAISLDKFDWRVRLLAGTLSLAQGQYEQALRHYRVALDDKPNSSVIQLNIGIAYYLLGHSEKALREAKKSLGINPWNRAALSFFADVAIHERKELSTAERYLKLYLSLLPQEKSLTGRLADIYFIEGKKKDAIDLLEHAKDRFNDPSIWNNLGVLWADRQPRKAGNYYHKAIKVAGGVSHAHENRGASIAVLNLAHILLDAGEHKQVAAMLTEFMGAAQNSKYLQDEVLCRIPVALMRSLVLQDKPDIAVDFASQFVENSELHPLGRIDLAAAMASYHSAVTGDLAKALDYARLAYVLARQCSIAKPQINMSTNNLAFVLIEQDMLDEAKPLVEQLRVDMNFAEYAYATKGLFALRKGQLERGQHLYERAISSAQNKERKNAFRQKMNLELGRYWFQIGEYSRASRYLAKVIETEHARDMWRLGVSRKAALSLMARIKSIKD